MSINSRYLNNSSSPHRHDLTGSGEDQEEILSDHHHTSSRHHPDDVVIATGGVSNSHQPVDKYYFNYIVFYLLGMTTLLPWNFFVTAEDVSILVLLFFQLKFIQYRLLRLMNLFPSPTMYILPIDDLLL